MRREVHNRMCCTSFRPGRVFGEETEWLLSVVAILLRDSERRCRSVSRAVFARACRQALKEVRAVSPLDRGDKVVKWRLHFGGVSDEPVVKVEGAQEAS